MRQSTEEKLIYQNLLNISDDEEDKHFSIFDNSVSKWHTDSSIKLPYFMKQKKLDYSINQNSKLIQMQNKYQDHLKFIKKQKGEIDLQKQQFNESLQNEDTDHRQFKSIASNHQFDQQIFYQRFDYPQHNRQNNSDEDIKFCIGYNQESNRNILKESLSQQDFKPNKSITKVLNPKTTEKIDMIQQIKSDHQKKKKHYDHLKNIRQQMSIDDANKIASLYEKHFDPLKDQINHQFKIRYYNFNVYYEVQKESLRIQIIEF